MSWTRNAKFLGGHFWFLREGLAFTSPGAGTISSSSKPDANDPLLASTAKLGICENFEVDPGIGQSEVILAPSPGRLYPTDEVVAEQQAKCRFMLKEVPVEAVQLALGTQNLLNSSSQFNPYGGSILLKGWLFVRTYRQDNTAALNLDLWVSLRLREPLKGDPKALTKPGFEGLILYSDLNTGSLLNS